MCVAAATCPSGWKIEMGVQSSLVLSLWFWYQTYRPQWHRHNKTKPSVFLGGKFSSWENVHKLVTPCYFWKLLRFLKFLYFPDLHVPVINIKTMNDTFFLHQWWFWYIKYLVKVSPTFQNTFSCQTYRPNDKQNYLWYYSFILRESFEAY